MDQGGEIVKRLKWPMCHIVDSTAFEVNPCKRHHFHILGGGLKEGKLEKMKAQKEKRREKKRKEKKRKEKKRKEKKRKEKKRKEKKETIWVENS